MTITFRLRQDIFDELKMKPELTHEVKPYELWVRLPPNIDDTFLLKANSNSETEVLERFSNILIKYIKQLYPKKNQGLININTGAGFIKSPILEGSTGILDVLDISK